MEWRNDDSVWFDILAVSKPGGWLARLAYPLARAQQRQFARDSAAAFVAAVADES